MAVGQLKKMEKIWKGQDKVTKLKIVRACIFPTAIYGCEGWTLTTADEKKINAFEMKCYRRMLRIPWIAKRKNTVILKELKVGQNWLLNNIKARKLSYLGHLKRHNSLGKHILEARLEGKRRKGRPIRRWAEDMKERLQISPTEAGREVQKREVLDGGFRRQRPHRHARMSE
ncbi:endonuclease-reverse transcriptase [Elysia marginata]|uniref:Endonuclease-reverse transcriptase n=1 Tax=Elysia marginata TaxID=1093978 RepID=A0AAV4IIG4_9GAST|nr:endonuclease-reverse transcriptase [Elysia marginata]